MLWQKSGRWQHIVIACILLGGLSGCASPFGALSPVTRQGLAITNLFSLVLALSFLLLFIVLVPYPTQLLGYYVNSGVDGSVAAGFYAVVMTGMGITFQVLVAWAVTHPQLLKPSVNIVAVRATVPRYSLGLLVYAASIGLAFVNAWFVIALYALSAIYYAFNQLTWSADEPAGT